MKKILLVLLLFLVPFVVSAHGYWIETKGTGKKGDTVTIKLYFGDYPAGERMTGKSLDKMKDIDVFVTAPDGGKYQIPMQQGNEYWLGHYIAEQKGTYTVTGVNDTRAVQDWTKHNLGITRPIQYLKASDIVGRASAPGLAGLPLDVQVEHVKKDNYELTLYKNGKPLGVSDVVFAPYGKPEDILKTDEHGKAYFTSPDTGLYIISVDWIDKTPGTFKEKPYESVRHRLDYSFYKD